MTSTEERIQKLEEDVEYLKLLVHALVEQLPEEIRKELQNGKG